MRIAVLGCGNMGRAIISSLLKRYDDISIIAYDKSETSLTYLPDEALVVPPDEWDQPENQADAVVVAVKPQDMSEALSVLSPLAERPESPVFISIAAGVTIAAIEHALPAHTRVCRVMPNTPAMVGEAMSAYCLNSRCRDADKSTIEYVLRAFGAVLCVSEKLMNPITGLSGSGPAYVYLFIEALIEGGVAAGLPYATARECAVQTVIGAARMVQVREESPSALKAAVMSPGGTTVRGLLALEKNKFKFSVIKAVVDASARAEELGKRE